MNLNRRRFTAGAVGLGMAAAANPHVLANSPDVAFRMMQSEDGNNQIIIGLSQEPTKFNPLGTRIEVDESVHYQLFDTLWGVDETGQYFPVLATEVPTLENGGISEDGLTWNVKLRDDVTWHDGEPFTAEDVKFSWELIMRDDFLAQTRQGHDRVTEFEVVSPTEVRWTMSEIYAPYLAIWAISPPVPKHILEAMDDPNSGDFNNNPIGTGAFRWDNRVAGDSITLVRNENYYGEGPFVDTLVFKYIPDTTMLFTQFRTGEIDHTDIQGITAEHHAEAITLEDRQIHDGPSSSVEFLAFNNSRPQFQDRAVREALYLAVDKQTIIDQVYYGLPLPTESYLFAQSWGYNPDLPVQEYDPDRANQLLDEAGWTMGSDGIREKDGVRLEFTISTTAGNQVREQTQAYLQQTWAEIGAGVEINNLPAAVIWGDFYLQSEFDMVMIGLVIGVGPDPDPTRVFHSKSPQGTHGTNVFMINDPDLDALLEQGVETVDQEERVGIYHEIQALMREQLYLLPVFQYAMTLVSKAGLTGFVRNPNYRTDSWNVKTWRWE